MMIVYPKKTLFKRLLSSFPGSLLRHFPQEEYQTKNPGNTLFTFLSACKLYLQIVVKNVIENKP